MILANYSKNDLLPVLGMYQKWLKEMVELLTNEITEENESIEGLQAKIEAFFSVFDCTYPTPGAVQWSDETWSATTIYHDVDPQVSVAAGEMIADKIMPWDQVPHSAELLLTKMQYMVYTGGPFQPPPDTCSGQVDSRRQAFKAVADPLPELGLKLMSRRALKHAAETTLNALIEQQKVIEQLG